MKLSNLSVVEQASSYISKLFDARLPKNLLFHNKQHTLNVIRGVKDICYQMELSSLDRQVLLLAAWFHDSGHVVKYIGHELESQKLANNWLESYGYPPEQIQQVIACIGATTMPQKPIGILQEVICDADLYHLSLEEYCHLQFQLKEEINLVFNRTYEDQSWMDENLYFIQNHRYFTSYGREILEPRKQVNYMKCRKLLV